MPASVPIASNGFAKGTAGQFGGDRPRDSGDDDGTPESGYAPLFLSHFSSGFQSSWCERTASAW